MVRSYIDFDNAGAIKDNIAIEKVLNTLHDGEAKEYASLFITSFTYYYGFLNAGYYTLLACDKEKRLYDDQPFMQFAVDTEKKRITISGFIEDTEYNNIFSVTDEFITALEQLFSDYGYLQYKEDTDAVFETPALDAMFDDTKYPDESLFVDKSIDKTIPSIIKIRDIRFINDVFKSVVQYTKNIDKDKFTALIRFVESFSDYKDCFCNLLNRKDIMIYAINNVKAKDYMSMNIVWSAHSYLIDITLKGGKPVRIVCSPETAAIIRQKIEEVG